MLRSNFSLPQIVLIVQSKTHVPTATNYQYRRVEKERKKKKKLSWPHNIPTYSFNFDCAEMGIRFQNDNRFAENEIMMTIIRRMLFRYFGMNLLMIKPKIGLMSCETTSLLDPQSHGLTWAMPMHLNYQISNFAGNALVFGWTNRFSRVRVTTIVMAHEDIPLRFTDVVRSIWHFY